jgi:hypothetical protein
VRRVVACYTSEVVDKVERRVATSRVLLGYEFFLIILQLNVALFQGIHVALNLY